MSEPKLEFGLVTHTFTGDFTKQLHQEARLDDWTKKERLNGESNKRAKNTQSNDFKQASRDDQNIDFNSVTHNLHKLSREWLSPRQDIEDYQDQLAFLKSSYTALTGNLHSQTKTGQITTTVSVCDHLRTLQS